jgi:flavorubredoxin
MDQFTVEYILSNIQVAHCLDRIELIAASHQLPDQIRSLGQVIQYVTQTSLTLPNIAGFLCTGTTISSRENSLELI